MLRQLFTRRRESAPLSRPKRSVLVVDDDTDIPPLVELALARYDFEIEGVNDGASWYQLAEGRVNHSLTVVARNALLSRARERAS